MKDANMTINIYHLDDDVQVLERFERIFFHGLLGRPVSVQSFEQASELESTLQPKPAVDIFILDVHLQDETPDGVRLAEFCRGLYPDAVIFMCSNATDLRTIRSSLLVGATDYIAKESLPEEIISRVEAALKDRNASDRLFAETSKMHAGSTLSLVKLRMPQLIDSAVNCVYILGESGTGKEVVADLLEAALPKGTPFIKLNCGSISQSLIASELFGHAKGSFTGAVADKPGIIEAANNGWIFLDEVATLPMDAQVSLLRAIDNQAIRRVGSTTERKVNFRIISATNEPLSELVDKGTFRRDLWQRLRETQIELPPLRERRHELPELIDHFCTSMRGGPYQLAPTVVNILCTYTWKEGNIRELRNCLRAMTEKSIDRMLTPRSIPEHIWVSVDLNAIKAESASDGRPLATESSLTVEWQGNTRPPFEDLSNRLLIEAIRQEYKLVGCMSLRSAAKAMGIAKSSMAGKIKTLLECKAIALEELGKMIQMIDEKPK
jgi:DNA-binding NtrC family response regulator